MVLRVLFCRSRIKTFLLCPVQYHFFIMQNWYSPINKMFIGGYFIASFMR